MRIITRHKLELQKKKKLYKLTKNFVSPTLKYVESLRTLNLIKGKIIKHKKLEISF